MFRREFFKVLLAIPIVIKSAATIKPSQWVQVYESPWPKGLSFHKPEEFVISYFPHNEIRPEDVMIWNEEGLFSHKES